jgi:hypothetical protein
MRYIVDYSHVLLALLYFFIYVIDYMRLYLLLIGVVINVILNFYFYRFTNNGHNRWFRCTLYNPNYLSLPPVSPFDISKLVL